MTREKSKRKWFYVILILLLLGAGAFYFLGWVEQNGSNQRYRLVRVERGEIRSTVTATGTINPVITVLVGSQVSGTIKALYANFNSRVKEGQVIAQIDPAIFEAQVEQARANVLKAQASSTNARAAVQNAQANLEKAGVAVVDTKRTLDRNLQLMDKKAVAQAALDTAQANYESAVAQNEAARAQLEVAKAQVESETAQVEYSKAALKMAETNLNYTTIRSPVTGIVISRNVDVGQTVAASLQAPTLFTIAKDLTQMQVDTNFSEADIGRIEMGQEATFTVDAYPERAFHGRVSEIRNAPQTIQNVVTYDVVINVSNSDLRLKPGMTANVTIRVAHREGVLKIPNAVLRFRPEEGGGEISVKVGKTEGVKKEGSKTDGRLSVALLTRELNLTQDQRTKVEGILRGSRNEIQAARQNAKPEEAQTRVQNLIRQKISGILTEEQRRKLAEMGSPEQEAKGRPGRAWIPSPEGKPAPVSVVLGITDGTFSEVISGDLREGTEIIVGETFEKKNQNQGTPSPFMRRGLGK